MRRDELERAIRLGSAGVRVFSSSVPAFPSRVVDVTIFRGFRVQVEYHVYGFDDGGPRYEASYTSLDALVKDLEAFFGQGLEMWENFTASGRYPDEPAGWDGRPCVEEEERFQEWVAAGRLRRPSGRYRQLSPYWAEVEAGSGIDGGSA